jgi:twitching motility protein PilT
MNRSAEIVDCLTKRQGLETILMVPGAPPISKTTDGISVALNVVLTAEDIADTFMALKAQAPRTEGDTAVNAGTFSFGIRKVGRFRVSHATQRGTKVLSITRIPSQVPNIKSLTPDVGIAEDLVAFLTAGAGGALTLHGPDVLTNSLVTYALIKAVNDGHRKLVYIIERSLTFLIQHDNSVIIQMELGTDVPSIEKGVQDCLSFTPDILVVGNIRSTDVLPSLQCAVDTGIMAVLCSNSMNGAALMEAFVPRLDHTNGVRSISTRSVKVTALSQGQCRLLVGGPNREAG